MAKKFRRPIVESYASQSKIVSYQGYRERCVAEGVQPKTRDGFVSDLSNSKKFLFTQINENEYQVQGINEHGSSYTPIAQFDHPDQSGGITMFQSGDGGKYAVYWTEGDSTAIIVDVDMNARVGRIIRGEAAPAEFQPMADALRSPMANAQPMSKSQRDDHDLTMS